MYADIATLCYRRRHINSPLGDVEVAKIGCCESWRNSYRFSAEEQ